MNARGMQRLLAEILDGQIDGGEGERLSPERIATALTDGPPLTDTERDLIWTRPVARARYLAVHDRIRRRIHACWDAAGVEREVLPRSALDASAPVRSIVGRDFGVHLYLESAEPPRWTVSLALERSVLDCLKPQTRVRLVDTGGLDWVTGCPDSRGEINDFWMSAEHSPMERLAAHRLRIEVA